MTLGEKIKSLRIAKGLTQRDVAGERITRNMLSRIECDKANPSLDTLTYLSDKLDTPMYMLFADGLELAVMEKASLIDKIHESFEYKNYKACISFINRISVPDEELTAILAISYFELGKQNLFKGELISSKKNLECAKEYIRKTIFDLNHIDAAIPMYLSVSENIQAPRLVFNEADYVDGFSASYDYEFYKYITQDFSYKYKNQMYEKHLRAKLLMKERSYKEAVNLLLEIAERNIGSDYNSLVVFGVYTDLEISYKELLDFENAYRYSSKRLSLLTAFKS